MYLATKTLNMINSMIQKDQGAKFRECLGKVINHIGDAYNPEEQTFRSHLGASMIGRECAREIWYGWRWAVKPNFEGRMIRLFNRGHLEEARFLAMFLMIGCDVYQQDENGKQYRISHAEGHFGGSGDGVLIGLPDLAPGTAALAEFKTHNSKSFAKLVSVGVKEAKPEHYVQMNTYMGKMGLGVALYGAVNKDNDELHLELIPYDSNVAGEFLDRGERLVWMESPPPKIGATIGFWKCRMCNNKGVCQLGEAPNVNCRTCEYSRPIQGAQWACTNPGIYGEGVSAILDKETMLTGCSHYERKKDF